MALNIAERLRNDVAATTLPTPNRNGSDMSSVTVSIGIACYPEHGGTVEVLLENVDKALYRAKHRGRNRAEVFS